MTERRPKLLFDAIAAIEASQAFLTGRSLQEYEADLLLRSATEHQLKFLARHVPTSRAKTHRCSFVRRLPFGDRPAQSHHPRPRRVDDETVDRRVREDLSALEAPLQAWLAEFMPDA